MSRRKKPLRTFWQKALSSFLCITMMYTIPVLNTKEVSAQENSPTPFVSDSSFTDDESGGENLIINPRILIQHYLNYEYQELGNIEEEFGGSTNYFDPQNASKLANLTPKQSMVWNTNARTEPTQDMTPTEWKAYLETLRPQNAPDGGITASACAEETDSTKCNYKAAREADPKYLMHLEDEINESQIENIAPNSKAGEIKTVTTLYRLFGDEAVRYFEKPAIRYMNKLFNTWNSDIPQPADFNENYTLSQIWLAYDSQVTEDPDTKAIEFNGDIKNEFKNDSSSFIKINVPVSKEDPKRHDPEKIYFTNDPNNLELNGKTEGWQTIQNSNSKIKYATGPDGAVMIHVVDGLIIRFIFDPLDGDETIDDVDFFDYDITNGYIYPSVGAAQAAFNDPRSLQLIVYNTNDRKFYTAKEDVNGVVIQSSTEAPGINIVNNELTGDLINSYYFPTSTQTQTESILSKQVWYALTFKQGVNVSSNGTYYNYAFGNINTFTGLGDLRWQYGPDSKDSATPNRANNNNYFTNNRKTAPNLHAATFNLVNNINSQSTISNQIVDWNDINAPDIFNIYSSQKGVTVYSESAQTDSYFPLNFKRSGGTYVLNKVLKKEAKKDPDGNLIKDENNKLIYEDSSEKLENLSRIRIVYKNTTKTIRSNQFWPMDMAPSYGTNGHDLKFGARGDGITEPRPVGNTSPNANTVNTQNEDNFPPGDDKKNHNSFFGMKFQIPFTLEDGYAAPLNYYFYGDDDMYVFLSKCERNDKGEIEKIDFDSTVLVADLGGVHSSIGMYVNLWNFINPNEKELIEVRQAKDTTNGVEERIYQYKAPTSTYLLETGEEEGTTPDDIPSQDYVLSFFYTERGASGSSCYMRFSVPFRELSTGPRVQNGRIQIGKDVKSASLVATTEEETLDDQKYVFELKMTNANDTDFINMYPIVIHNNEGHTSAMDEAIINSNPLDPQTSDVISGENFYVISNQGRFTLTSGQHAYIYNLPRIGPLGNNYTFEVEEVGLYNPEKALTDTPGGRENLYVCAEPLDPNTTTTFRSGQFNGNPSNDLFDDENSWVTGFEEGNIVSGNIDSQNKVEFINTKAPAALRLEKQLEAAVPDDFMGKFTFEIELKDENNTPFITIPWLSSIPPDGAQVSPEDSTNPNLYDRDPLTSPDKNGIFNVFLDPGEIIILYGLPLNTKFSITEIGVENRGNYVSILNELKTDGDVTSSEVEMGVVSGTLVHLPPKASESNSSTIPTSASAIYINILEKLNQLRIRKLLRPAPSLDLTGTDENYEFSFQIELKDENDQPLNDSFPFRYLSPNDLPDGSISLNDGIGHFRLKHNQEIEIYDLPEGTKWKVQELNNGTPVPIYGEIDHKYLLTWEEDQEGSLPLEDKIPTALFINLKFGSDNGGLKILTGNRPTGIKPNEFRFILNGISAQYEPNQNDSEMPDQEESLDSTESDSSSQETDSTTESPKDFEETDTTESNEAESGGGNNDNSSSTSAESSSSSSSVSSEDSSSETIPESSPENEENVSEETSPSESTEDSSSKESQEESSSAPFQSDDESVVRLKVKRMNRYIQPMSINIAPNLAQYLTQVKFLKEKISSSFSLLSPLKEEGIGVVEGTTNLPPMPEGIDPKDSYYISLTDITDNTGSFSFPDISFKKAGTYIYTLEEEIPTQSDSTITYDSVTYWVKVTVGTKSENSNELEVKSIDYFKNEELTDPVENNIALFTNNYTPPTTPPEGGGGGTPKPSISLVKEQRRITNEMALSWNKLDRNNPMQVNPGDQIEYRITASNTSNTTAQNVVIKDTLPIPEGTDAQLVLDQVSLQGQDVTLNGRELTWKVGNLTRKGTSGASKSVTFKVNVPEVTGHTIWPNTATATFGPNPDNPSGSITSNTVVSEATPGEIIPGEAHIRLLKEQRKISGTTASDWNTQDRNNPMIVAGGDIVEYRLTTTASGDKTLSNVVIQDKIPDFEGAAGNLTLIPGSLSGEVNVNNGVITWNLGSMQPGESKSVTFQVVVPITEGQTLWANMATVSYGEDPNNPEETVPSNTVVIEENPASAKIKLFKEQRKIVNGVASEWNTQDRINPMMVNGGDVVEYRVTATVQGQTPLHNVTIRDQIPNYEGSPGLLILDENSLSGNVTFDNGLITWNIGTMQPGESQSVTFQVLVPKTEGITLWSNVATVSHGEDPNHPEETISSNVVTIAEGPNTGEPDISLVKQQRLIRNGVASDWNTQGKDNPMAVQANDIVEYRLVVTNTTAHAVPNVVVKDTIPSPSGSNAQLTLIDQKTTKGSTRVDGHVLIWEIGNMAPQEVVNVYFQVRVPAVSAATLWPNIGYATYGEDPNHPDKEVPSNEVDIREDPDTSGNTPPNTSNTTPSSPNTSTTPNTNNTNNTSNSETSSSSKNPATKPGTYATTGANTNTNTWIIVGLVSLAVLCLGGYWWSTNKKRK